MATVTKWVGVAVAMQSALAAADTITAITKASPGVVTATAHGFVNGDYIVHTVQGMVELDGKVVRVANKTNDTYELEGVNTTAYTTFTSGTAELITFGTSITTAMSMDGSGGDFGFEDVTTIHDYIKKQIPTLANPITYSMEHLWDSSDAGQVAMKAASEAQAKRAFKFTFGTGGKIITFSGYVGFVGTPTGQAPGVVKTPAVITAFGTPTYYAS